MSTVLIFGIIYFSCGFSELIGASIYGVFFIYSSYCRNGYVDCLQNWLLGKSRDMADCIFFCFLLAVGFAADARKIRFAFHNFIAGHQFAFTSHLSSILRYLCHNYKEVQDDGKLICPKDRHTLLNYKISRHVINNNLHIFTNEIEK